MPPTSAETAGIVCRIDAFGPRLIAAQSLHLAACFTSHSYPHEIAEFDHLLVDPYDGLDVETGKHCEYDLRIVFDDGDIVEDTTDLCETGSYTVTD